MASLVHNEWSLVRFYIGVLVLDLQIPILMVYKAPDVQSTYVKHKGSTTDIVTKIHETLWIQMCDLFSWFTLMCLTSQVVSQMHLTVYYTYAFMCRSILYMIIFPSVFPNFLKIIF